MARSEGELNKLNLKELKKLAGDLKKATKEPFIKNGMEAYISNGKKDELVKYVSLCEGLTAAETAVETVVETAVETVVEPENDYSGYYQELEAIAKKYYEGDFNADSNSWHFVGIREYCTRLVIQNVPFLPEFFSNVQ